MWIIRWPLGRLILLLNVIFSPSAPKRSAEEQSKLDAATAHLTLYQLPACPFCVKVRRAIKRQGLHIAIRNINKDQQVYADLVEFGGSRKVPCLRIANTDNPSDHHQAKWLYESSDIVEYLAQVHSEC